MTTSNARALAWHRECLVNSRQYLARQQQALERLQAEVVKLQVATEFHAIQIEEAERRGMDSFDSARLLIKKRA